MIDGLSRGLLYFTQLPISKITHVLQGSKTASVGRGITCVWDVNQPSWPHK